MKLRVLETGQIYHVYKKSIAGLKIFNNENEYARMIRTLAYYQNKGNFPKFSDISKKKRIVSIAAASNSITIADKLVDLIAYCLMPTHLHLILKQLQESGISRYMSDCLNSYTRYFNIKCDRKGTLWETRFKDVLVVTDEQLLHLTRYIHLNPVTAYLVNTPEEWPWSSYNEYLSRTPESEKICNFNGLLEINPGDYRKFVSSMISEQRELAKAKSLIK